jgi:transcriptional regulator with GAF, ATPase, and Fis domain
VSNRILRRLLATGHTGRPTAFDRLVALLSDDQRSGLCVQDNYGNLLWGSDSATAGPGYPILFEGVTLGQVRGGPAAARLADSLSSQAAAEADRRALAAEVLERYRELNLIYNLSARLSASLDLHHVAQTAIDEAGRLIHASRGAVLLVDDEAPQELYAAAVYAQGLPGGERLLVGQGVLGGVALFGEAEIVNHLSQDPRRSAAEAGLYALLCAPLKAGGRVLGLLVMASAVELEYTAGDLKLLCAVADIAAPAIENASHYARMLREAQARQQHLEEQIRELRIELDEARQQRQAAEITETDYFKSLRQQAQALRQIMGEGNSQS